MSTSTATPLRRYLLPLVGMLFASPSAVATPTGTPEHGSASQARRIEAEKTPGAVDFITRPQPSFPADGARLRNGQVTFEWEESVDPYQWPLRYAVRVFRGGFPVIEMTTEATFITLTEEQALTPERYTWQVWAYNSRGTSSVSESRFTIVIDTEEPGGGGEEPPPDSGTPGTGGPSVGPFPPPSVPLQESSGCTTGPGAQPSSSAMLLLATLGLLGGALRRRGSPRHSD